MQFEPDFASVMHQLIHQSEKPTELKDALNLHTNYFMGIMQQNKHQNLRTFQFFLSKIDFLYEELQSTGIDSKYYKQLLDFLIENCFLLCVEFKGNIKEPEDDFAKIRFQNKRRLTSVDSYVRSSIFNGEEFKTELEQYVYAELSQHLLPNDPYSLLYNEYYMHTQEWVENTIQAMLEKLKQDAYAINTYPNLILVLVLLKQHGFSEDYIKQAMNYMIQNVEKQDVHEHRLDDHVPAQDGNVIRECKEYIEKVNKAIYTLQEEQWSQSMRDILEKKEDWASQLSSYIDSIKGSMPYESLIFDRVDADIWVQKILASDACNINSFRRFLNQIYPSNVIKRNVKKDMLVLKEIGEKVQQHEETDLIKKMQLSWLTEQIGEICKRNGGVCKNVK